MGIDKRIEVRRNISSNKEINYSYLKNEINSTFDIFNRKKYLNLLYKLISKIEDNNSLSVQESEIMFLVVIASNNESIYNKLFKDSFIKDEIKKLATIVLFEMRFKEERGNITSDEIIGMLLASKYDLTYEFYKKEGIIETCGMGGDKGFDNEHKGDLSNNETETSLSKKIQKGFLNILKGNKDLFDYYNYLYNEIILPDKKLKSSRKSKSYKTINISTLTSIFLSKIVDSLYVMKHGSGKNTSAVGSTDAAINLCINVILENIRQYEQELDDKRFIYTDAKIFKSLHDISGSFIKTETVNHLIGPLTPPIHYLTPYYKILGINHNINIDVMGETFEKMKKYKLYNVKNALIIGGLDKSVDNYYFGIEKDIKLDEFSPISTVFGLVVDGKYIGKGIIKDEDFGIKINIKNILLPNDENIILKTNKEVLNGTANDDLINLIVINILLGKILVDLDNKMIDLNDLIIDMNDKNNLKFNKNILKKKFIEIKEYILNNK